MTSLIDYQFNEGIATLKLQNGKVNAISPQLIEQFNAALDQAEQAKAVVVITGRLGMFSGGYDLSVMQQGRESMLELVTAGSTLSHRLLSYPYPVVAACTGHAIAKGAFLLLSSDVRIGLAGSFKIGLNEVAIGMPMHHVGIELARDRLIPACFNRAVYCAELFNPVDAVTAGFLDVVVEEAAFDATVNATAQALSKLDLEAHRKTKLKGRAGLLATLNSAIALDQQHI